MLDEIDRRILRHFLSDPDSSAAELASRAGVTPSTLRRRTDRLRDRGIIRGVETKINWHALGYTVQVSLRFTLDKSDARALDAFLQAARKIPQVIEIQTFLGSVDLRLSVIARDLSHWQEIHRNAIAHLPYVTDSDALMLVATLKDSQEVAL